MVFLFACALLTLGSVSACHLDNLTLTPLDVEDMMNQLEKQTNILSYLSAQCDNVKQQLNQSLDLTTYISQQVEVFERHLDAYKTILNISREGAPINNSTGSCFNEQQAQEQQLEVKGFLERLHKFERWLLFYFPTILVAEVVFVVLGNALVLFAIVKHKDMRIKPNALVLNIAIVDILYAVGYSIIEYHRLKWFFVPVKRCTLGMYQFMMQLFFSGFSGYSVSLLSLMRYLAASGDSPQYLRMQNVILLIAAVWMICGLYAVIVPLVTGCPDKQLGECFITNLIFLYISPMLTVLVTYLGTARIIRRSLMILENNHDSLMVETQRRLRERSGYMTICLTVLFCVSNLPVHLCSWFDCSINCFGSFQWSFLMNSALNPLALYIGGERFRQHFNEYFYWCFLKISNVLHLGAVFKRTATHIQQTICDVGAKKKRGLCFV